MNPIPRLHQSWPVPAVHVIRYNPVDRRRVQAFVDIQVPRCYWHSVVSGGDGMNDRRPIRRSTCAPNTCRIPRCSVVSVRHDCNS
jgi:hypothetical protein